MRGDRPESSRDTEGPEASRAGPRPPGESGSARSARVFLGYSQSGPDQSRGRLLQDGTCICVTSTRTGPES